MNTQTHPPAPPTTGAELQTLREACSMTRDDLAALADVQARTIKHWENGRAAVPGDVAALMRDIDAAVDKAAWAEYDALRAAWVPGALAVLVRYKTAHDLREAIAATIPAHRHRGHYAPELWVCVPFCAAGAVAMRAAMMWRHTMQAEGGTMAALQLPHVVWFDAEHFAQWRAVHNQPDIEATRMAWARHAVGVQATPRPVEPLAS